MSMPGVQKPHWTPPASRNARWSGCEIAVGREALDRRDAATLGLEREERARVHGPAVEQHHAGAALGVVAALLAAGEPEVVAQDRQEGPPRLDLDGIAECR